MFFGAPLQPHANTEEAREEASLIGAVNAAETEQPDAKNASHPAPTYSWWNVLMGRHDDDIFSHFVKSQQQNMVCACDFPRSVEVAETSYRISKIIKIVLRLLPSTEEAATSFHASGF